jgi:predicted histidine transporter YuiF (NhaC family)
MEKTKKTNLLISALIESWFGVGILIAFVIEFILGASSIVLGALAVLMAVLFMNGFAKTDLFFTEQGSFTFNFLKYGQR